MAEVLIETQLLRGASPKEMNGIPCYSHSVDNGLVEPKAGEKYRVHWDGSDYVCTAYQTTMEGIDLICLGNEQLVMQGVMELVEPFLVFYYVGYGLTEIFCMTDDDHYFGVYEAVEAEPGAEALIETQEINSFSLQDVGATSCYLTVRLVNPFSNGYPEVGKKYKVYWDGNLYECTAYQSPMMGSTSICLGNEKMLTEGVIEPVEPFAFVYDTKETMVMILAMDTKTSHYAGIYCADPAIVLKDMNGNDVFYDGVTAVKLNLSNGSKQIFSKGEAADKTVELDFSAGDMDVAESDKLFSTVTIPKPTNLIAENIAEGVDIAGIIGTLAGGGGSGNFKFASAKISTAGAVEITHNLGVVPDVIVVQMDGKYKGSLYYATWFSPTLCTAIGASRSPSMYAYIDSASGKDFFAGTSESEPAIRNVTPNSFVVGSATYPAVAITSGITVGKSTWYAISFLG